MTVDLSGEIVHLRRSEYDVRIDRKTVWGNPFVVGPDGTREEVIEKFAQWATGSSDFAAVWIREHVHELIGKRLGCWCAPQACHGEVLLSMAINTQLTDEGRNQC